MAIYQVGEGQFEIPDEVQGAQLQGVLEGLARQESGDTAPQLPKSQFLAENLKEIGESPELNELSKSGFLTSLSALSITDPKELGEALSSQVPGSFVSIDSQGNHLINFPSGTFAINKPGFSGQDVAQFVSRAAAFTPAGIGLKGPLTKKALTAGARSAGIEAGLQTGEAALGGEFDPSEVVSAGVFGVAGEGVISGISAGTKALIGKIRNLKRARREKVAGFEAGGAQQAIRQADIAQAAQRETGIGLTKAQKTTEPFLLEEQSFVSQLPEGSKRALEFLTKQNAEAGQAVENFLNSVAAPSAVISGPRNLRTSAQKAVELRKLSRQESTSPIYNQAFEDFRASGQVVNVDSVLSEIAIRKRQYPSSHAAFKALSLFEKEIAANKGDLGRLHGVKEVIDTRIANFSTGKPTAATNKAAREAAQVQESLVASMEDVSTQYRRARTEFIRQSGPINEIRDSVVGIIADLPDSALKNVSQKLLDPSQTNHEMIRQAKRMIRKTEGGADSWNQIVRSELERRLGSAKTELNQVISGDVSANQNVPALLLNSLGLNKIRTRRALMTALSPVQRRNLEFLETSLKRAAIGRPGGSQTGIRAEIKSRLDKGIVSAIRNFMRSPLTAITEIGEEGARSARIRALSDSIFDDNWSPQLAEVRALKNAGKESQSEKKMLELLKNVEQASIARGLIQAIRGDE